MADASQIFFLLGVRSAVVRSAGEGIGSLGLLSWRVLLVGLLAQQWDAC